MKSSNVEQLAYTVEQAQKILPVSRTRLYEAMGAGDLRSFKDGRRRLISAAALREFMAKIEREGAGSKAA